MTLRMHLNLISRLHSNLISAIEGSVPEVLADDKASASTGAAAHLASLLACSAPGLGMLHAHLSRCDARTFASFPLMKRVCIPAAAAVSGEYAPVPTLLLS